MNMMTMTTLRTTRRCGVRLLAMGLTAWGLGVFGVRAGSTRDVAMRTSTAYSDPRLMQDDLLHLFADHRAAAAIGREYLLGQLAQRATLVSLKAQLMCALQLDDADLRGQYRAELSTRFRSRIRQDFAEGNVAIVDGWVLSQVEAQACAFASLSTAGIT